MADITMCQGRHCDLKEKCYRFTATPSDYQSWSAFDDGMSFFKDECEYFWSIEEEEEE